MTTGRGPKQYKKDISWHQVGGCLVVSRPVTWFVTPPPTLRQNLGYCYPTFAALAAHCKGGTRSWECSH